MVDLAGQFVPKRTRIAVRTDRSVVRFPSFELVLRAALGPENLLELAHLANGPGHLPVVAAPHGAFAGYPRTAGSLEGVLIFVDIQHLVAPEIDRVGIVNPSAAEHLGMM